MTPYWILFGVPALAAIFERRRKPLGHSGYSIFFPLVVTAVGVFVGLRYEVGGDWISYVNYLMRASFEEALVTLGRGDPGYALLNWLAGRLGAEIWLVNLICGGLFSWGLFRFAMAQPRPWLALTVAIPYLVVVVAMGYTRQGVAIGLAMQGLVAMGSQRSNVKFVAWVLLAAAFHKSAVLLIPIAALAERRGRLWTAFWVGCATVIAYFTLLESGLDRFITSYLESNYESSGAAIRVGMNAIPAFIFIFNRGRFSLQPQESGVWLMLSILALAMLPMLYYSPSSTAVDRVGLYLIPLQLMVLSRFPNAFAASDHGSRLLAILVTMYSATVQFVWLNYASHADLWLPYRMYGF